MNININAPVVEYYFSALTYMTYAALAKNVKFFKTYLLGGVHIPLCSRKTFRGHIESGIAGDRFFGDKNASGMYTAHVGKVCNLQAR